MLIATDICRNQRAKPIIIDPGLYLSKKSDIATTTQRRSLPTSFKLFTGESKHRSVPVPGVVFFVINTPFFLLTFHLFFKLISLTLNMMNIKMLNLL